MAIIHSQYRECGIPVVDQQRCTRCHECVRVCPADVLGIDAGRVFVRNDSPLGCVACGHCMMVCPEANRAADALILGHPAVGFKRAIRRRFTSVHSV
jgi:ferredoxin